MASKEKQRYLMRFVADNGDEFEVEAVEQSELMAKVRGRQHLREWVAETKHEMASRHYWELDQIRILENGE